MPINTYKELVVWKVGTQISLEIYQLTRTFPRSETFGLVSQMRRASVSIPSNIAEGFCRFSRKDFSRFLSQALGSCGELECQILISEKLGYFNGKNTLELKKLIETELKMIKTLIKKSREPKK